MLTSRHNAELSSRSPSPTRIATCDMRRVSFACRLPLRNELRRAHPTQEVVHEQAPSSHIGAAVLRALGGERQRPIPQRMLEQFGQVSEIILNTPERGDEALRAITAKIRRAQKFVCIENYRIRFNDPAAQELFQAIAERQRECPEFKVYFAFNVLTGSAGRLLEQQIRGVGIRADIALHINGLSRRSLHSKLFIIDGEEAFVGGENIDNTKEKDLVVGVRGPVVAGLHAEFINAFLSAKRRTNGAEPLRIDASLSRLALEGPSSGMVPMTILTKYGVPLIGDYYNNDPDQAMLAAMKEARRVIKIASPNINDEAVMHELIEAAKRGVLVQLLVPLNYENLGSFADRFANRALLRIRRVLPPAVSRNFQVRWFSADGVNEHANHTKFMSVDDVWCYVGSQNFDNQAWSYSRELGLGIDNAMVTARISKAAFDDDWERGLKPKLRWVDSILLPPSSSLWHYSVRIKDNAAAFAARIRKLAGELFLN